ncbi:hypothetical protein KRR40_47470 [Niabella defluvii]|nr:hypothetical protein KRR40_47470 [Niabella sp. I65]
MLKEYITQHKLPKTEGRQMTFGNEISFSRAGCLLSPSKDSATSTGRANTKTTGAIIGTHCWFHMQTAAMQPYILPQEVRILKLRKQNNATVY